MFFGLCRHIKHGVRVSSVTVTLENALVFYLPKPNRGRNIGRNETMQAGRSTFVAFPWPQPSCSKLRPGLGPLIYLCLGWSGSSTKCSFPEKGEFSCNSGLAEIWDITTSFPSLNESLLLLFLIWYILQSLYRLWRFLCFIESSLWATFHSSAHSLSSFAHSLSSFAQTDRDRLSSTFCFLLSSPAVHPSHRSQKSPHFFVSTLVIRNKKKNWLPLCREACYK